MGCSLRPLQHAEKIHSVRHRAHKPASKKRNEIPYPKVIRPSFFDSVDDELATYTRVFPTVELTEEQKMALSAWGGGIQFITEKKAMIFKRDIHAEHIRARFPDFPPRECAKYIPPRERI
jgi:hypothetical protein